MQVAAVEVGVAEELEQVLLLGNLVETATISREERIIALIFWVCSE